MRTLPLFVVQAAIAGSVGVTAMTGVFVFGCRLRPSDTSAIIVLVVGLGLLGASARGQHAAHLSHLGGWLLLIGVFVVASAGIIAARIPDPRGAIGLAACAGLGFTGTAVAARALHVPTQSWRVALEPVAIALVLYGVCGMLMFASALQRGSVTATSAVMFAVETIVPSIVGLTALGDRTRPHFEIVAALGFSLTVGASIALARYTETIVLIEPAPEQATWTQGRRIGSGLRFELLDAGRKICDHDRELGSQLTDDRQHDRRDRCDLVLGGLRMPVQRTAESFFDVIDVHGSSSPVGLDTERYGKRSRAREPKAPGPALDGKRAGRKHLPL